MSHFCMYVYRFLYDSIQLVAKRNETRQEFEEKANDIDLVTATDKEVEQLLINGLLDSFPDHK